MSAPESFIRQIEFMAGEPIVIEATHVVHDELGYYVAPGIGDQAPTYSDGAMLGPIVERRVTSARAEGAA